MYSFIDMRIHTCYGLFIVKKTLTVPKWMNDEGVRAGINFSQLLQEALMEKIETR